MGGFIVIRTYLHGIHFNFANPHHWTKTPALSPNCRPVHPHYKYYDIDTPLKGPRKHLQILFCPAIIIEQTRTATC
jgi:hypothetical protein